MEPIKRSTVLEEVNGSEILLQFLHYLVRVEEGGYLETQVEERSAEAQICAAQAVAAVEREGSQQASELSTGKISRQAPGWTKRLRIGAAAPGRMPCPNCAPR